MADSEKIGGAVSGAAQGAAAGAVFGGVGAIIGGAVGALAGAFGGRKRSQAKRYKKQLLKYQRFVARKELLLESRRQQAEAANVLAQTGTGTERTSGGFGVLGSIGSQRASAIRQSEFGIKRQDKIKKLESQANQIEGFISAASTLIPQGVETFEKFKDQKPPTISGNPRI